MSNIEKGFDEQSPEKEKLPLLSLIVLRHGEALPTKEHPKARTLTPEGIEYTRTTADQIAEVIGNPQEVIINNLSARNPKKGPKHRTTQTQEAVVERLREKGYHQFFQPIRTGKGGFTGEESLEISDKPREHTGVGAISRKIFNAKVTPEGKSATKADLESGQVITLGNYYKAEIEEAGLPVNESNLFLAWLDDDEVRLGIETPEAVKELWLSAIQKQQNDLVKLAQISENNPETAGKRLVTIVGTTNPRMDSLVNAVTGISFEEELKKGKEITPNSQGVKIDFFLDKPPEASVFGRADTSLSVDSLMAIVSEREVEEFTGQRKPVKSIEAQYPEFAKPHPIKSIKIKDEK